MKGTRHKAQGTRHKHSAFRFRILIYSLICILPTNLLYSQIDTTATPEVIYTIETDTMFAYESGLDSVFILSQDTTGIDTISLKEMAQPTYSANNYTNAKTFINPGEIGIDIGYQLKPVNDGLFGVHISGIFNKGALPTYDEESEDALQWLNELKPKSLRFPSGGSCKFMHLLPYKDTDGLPGLDPIKGYGYDIIEIIRYYDVTDNKIDVIFNLDLEAILQDMETDNTCDDCSTWLNSEDFREDFESFYGKWDNQNKIPNGKPSAIKQFVEVVNNIQVANPGHTVDIILCLNIFSETATQCKEIAKYIKYATQNGVANLNLVGVEIGNENYFKSSHDMLGMYNFTNYWTYVIGLESDADWWDDFADHVFTPAMLSDHNYLSAFKLDPLVACKIGIPATNINKAPYALKENGEISETDEPGATWNELLRAQYGTKIIAGGPFAFDAVVIHPYYTAVDNYQDIALLFDDSYTCPVFDFSTFDANLQPAFNGILGVTDPPLFGNFRDFIKTRYLESYDFHNDTLDFWINTSIKKELWTTEWNILDEFSDEEDEIREYERVNIYNNSFAGAFILHEWWLQNLKLNYTRNFRNNFFTYSHFHNYYGTQYQNNLVLDADCADMLQHGIDPDTYANDRLFLRRTNYYVMKNLSPISGQDLQYIRNNQFIVNTNPNLQVTTFLTQGKDTIYVYYSNLKQVDQHYIVNGESMTIMYPNHPIFGAPIGVQFGTARINCIDALQTYSTSGKSSIYDLNECYACKGYPEPALHWHSFEIRAENTSAIRSFDNIPSCYSTPLANEVCVTVPGYSIGYFKIPVSAVYTPAKTELTQQPGDLQIYPNPTSNSISFVSNVTATSKYGSIQNLYGNQLIVFNPKTTHNLDLTSLPSGIYFLSISGDFGELTKPFVKQ